MKTNNNQRSIIYIFCKKPEIINKIKKPEINKVNGIVHKDSSDK